MELHDTIKLNIDRLCGDADALVDEGDYFKAIDLYVEALNLIPEPIEKWEASTWVLTALGEALFFSEDFAGAAEYLKSAMHCPGAIGNPLIHLRLGQCQLELRNLDKAGDELTRAYMGAGREIFDGEDEKYFNFLSGKIEGI